jgi:Holliday junction resolvase RusA-like endonuclease
MSGPPVFSVTIPGDPVPASRPRFDSVRRRTYTTGKYAGWKHGAAILCRAAWGRTEPITRAVAVSLEVTLPRPLRRPTAGAAHRDYWHPTDDYPSPVKPDIDNLAKAALDALTQGRVIADDSLIVELSVTKYAGNTPGVTITVSIVEPEQAD